MRASPMFAAGLLGLTLTACGAEGSSPAADEPDAASAPVDATAPVPDTTPAAPDASPPDAAAAPPACPVAFAYDPLAGRALETFPDDFYTTPAPTRTGLRPDFSAERAPWVPATVGSYETTFHQLASLDGWGTTAGVILRFTGEVDAEGAATAIRWVALTGETTVDVPFEVRTADEGATLILWPMVPLKPATRHGVLVTEALRAVDGACIAPSPTLRALLAGDDRGAPALAGLPDRYAELLTRAGVPPEAVVGGTVFTTQSIVEDSVAIAEDIRGRAPTWGTPPTCVDAPAYRVCDGVFAAADYLEGLQAGFGPSPRPYDLPVRAYLPLATAEAPTPRPTVIFGHGLGSDRGQAAALAEFAVPLGMNVVSIDAPAHGDHPTAEGDSDIQRLAGFFGIDILEQRLDGLTLRDHWRQATYDKLQLVRLLALQGDLDADGVSDVDSEHIAYLGVSLGGIMGAELLALSPDVGLGVLSVPGGRVASIISDGPTFSILVRAMTPPGTPPGEVARFFPVLQTLIERGDAANYAPHVLGDRLPGAGDRAPHVLMAMAIDDTIVPNVCNRALARALGAPHVPPVLQTIGVVPLAEAAPVSGNRNDGRTTAGVFQFDRVAERPGEAPVRAEHDNLAKSVEGVLQATHFMETWITRGVPEIVDPYAELGTPPLPDAGSAR